MPPALLAIGVGMISTSDLGALVSAGFLMSSLVVIVLPPQPQQPCKE
jgi:hypothetical protein